MSKHVEPTARSESQAGSATKRPAESLQRYTAFAAPPSPYNEQQSRSIAEAIPTLVWTSQPDGYTDYFNMRWYEFTGKTWEEMHENGIKIVVHPDEYLTCRTKWKHSMQTGEIYEIEYRLRRASDGQYRWHLARAVPLRDSAGEIMKWFGTATDIDDQKRAKEALENEVTRRTKQLREAQEKDQANLQRLRSLIDNMPFGALISDEHQVILHVNQKFCELFDLSTQPADLLGKKGNDIVHMALAQTQFPAEYEERLKEAIAAQKIQSDQEIFLSNDRILLRDYYPIFVDEVSRGHVFIYRDVTQERRIDTAKSEFMSLASHQLRTPLTRMRWALGRIMKELARVEAAIDPEPMSVARNAVIHMSETISTMLSISRIEARKVTVKCSDVDVKALVDDIVSENIGEIERKKQDLVVQLPSTCIIRTDESILQEILCNLIENAVKYTPPGGSILIGMSQKEKHACITVADTGYGIPKYQQEKIFTKFFRGDNILQKNTDGSGLGLYLTYRLVGLLGGHISFASEEEKGTIFTILI